MYVLTHSLIAEISFLYGNNQNNTFCLRINLGRRAVVCTMSTGWTIGQSAQSPWPIIWPINLLSCQIL